MTGKCKKHDGHTHTHGPNCGHTAVRHDGHIDYLHDGCLHHPHEDHVDEHAVASGPRNPTQCTPNHACGAHSESHTHGPGCGHATVPHDGHMDYLVQGHLHHPHGSHCDDHGKLEIAA